MSCGAALRQAHLDGVAFVLQELPDDVLNVLVAPGNLLLQGDAEILLDVPVHTAGHRALSETEKIVSLRNSLSETEKIVSLRNSLSEIQKIISKFLSYDLGDI